VKRSWPQLALVGALALSVIANVFLLGAMARNIGGGSDAGMLVENAGRAYPAEVRGEFRRLLRDNRPRTLAALRDLRQARQRLAAAASSEALDEAELEIAMREVRAATETLQRTVQDLLLEALRRTRGGS
jgi:uncharacterized membrane protein